MRFLSWIGLLAAFTLFVGCEGSPVPLGPAGGGAIDPRLAGTWELASVTGEEDESGDLIKAFVFNESEYYVEYLDAEQGDDGSVSFDDTLRTRVFLTDVDGRLFANVQCINCDGDGSWYFVHVEFVDGRMLLRFVEDEAYQTLGKGATSADAMAYIRARADQADLYEEGTGIYVRVE